MAASPNTVSQSNSVCSSDVTHKIITCGWPWVGCFVSCMFHVSSIHSYMYFFHLSMHPNNLYVTTITENQDSTNILFWCKFEAIKKFKIFFGILGLETLQLYIIREENVIINSVMLQHGRNNNITFNRSMNNIDAAIRNASFLCQFHDKHDCTRVPLGWFHNHSVAANQCHRKHLQ